VRPAGRVSSEPRHYRVISAEHDNAGSAYRRFERQPLLVDPAKLLPGVRRHAVTAGVFFLVIAFAFLTWASL
jgi:hypothetical protein